MEGLGSQEWERGVGDREESGEGKAAEYQQRKGLCQAGIAKAAALCRRISRWRMAVFLLVGLFFYGGHQRHPALYLAAAAGTAVALVLAFYRKGLLLVAVGACLAAFLVKIIL